MHLISKHLVLRLFFFHPISQGTFIQTTSRLIPIEKKQKQNVILKLSLMASCSCCYERAFKSRSKQIFLNTPKNNLNDMPLIDWFSISNVGISRHKTKQKKKKKSFHYFFCKTKQNISLQTNNLPTHLIKISLLFLYNLPNRLILICNSLCD